MRAALAVVALACYGPKIGPDEDDGAPVDGAVVADGDRTGDAAAGCLTMLSAGNEHTCALRADGVAYCWGSNLGQQLTDSGDAGLDSCDTGPCWRTPRPVVGLPPARWVSAGANHTCVLRQSDGNLVCRGTIRGAVVEIPGATGATRMDSGLDFSCTLDPSGTVSCAGNNNRGQLARPPSTVYESASLLAVPLGDVRRVALGGAHACALDGEQKVWCWGQNAEGQLGAPSSQTCEGTIACSWDPLLVTLPGVSSIDLGTAHTCATTASDGAPYCWGKNEFGQLGDGATDDAASPHAVLDVRAPAVALAAGGIFTCALLEGGEVDCWGYNGDGEYGNAVAGANRANPSGFTGIAQLTAGNNHTCAITLEGGILCAGANGAGQVGNGSLDASVDSPAEAVVPCP